MLANKTIVQSDYQPLEASDVIEEVLRLMNGEAVNVFPVVDKTTRKLIGQVEYRSLLGAEDGALVSDLEVDEVVKIYEGQHIFEAARLMLQYELRILPMVDQELTFLGVITKQTVLEEISSMLNLAEAGSVITIELDPIDFSLSEIVQIIETEGAKILGITVEGPSEKQPTFEVSVKLNLKDISRVTAALKRYEYTILIESESTVLANDLEYRADELLKYIDM